MEHPRDGQPGEGTPVDEHSPGRTPIVTREPQNCAFEAPFWLKLSSQLAVLGR